MKNLINLISFVSASILAGIGIEDMNRLAIAGGLVFMALTVILVMAGCEKEVNQQS